jgi:hypothetical protein
MDVFGGHEPPLKIIHFLKIHLLSGGVVVHKKRVTRDVVVAL